MTVLRGMVAGVMVGLLIVGAKMTPGVRLVVEDVATLAACGVVLSALAYMIHSWSSDVTNS